MTKDEAIELIKRVATEAGADVALALAQAQQESQFVADATSKAGAIGLFQLMPGTAQYLGVDPNSPEQNIRGGVRFLASLRNQFKELHTALAAYNWGPGNVDHAQAKYGEFWPWYVPDETHGYVRAVMRNYDSWNSVLHTGGTLRV